MTTDGEAGARRSGARLWVAMFAGPVAASLQLSVNYALVKWACSHGGAWVLGALAATFLLLSVVGIALGATQLPRTGDDDPQLWSAQSRRLLAFTAVGVNALIGVFLLNSLIAIKALSPCE